MYDIKLNKDSFTEDGKLTEKTINEIIAHARNSIRTKLKLGIFNHLIPGDKLSVSYNGEFEFVGISQK